MRYIKGSTGSITVEASISMPIFLCVILTIALLIRIIYIHEVMQHAITETAKEMTSCSYFLKVCGIQDLNNNVMDTLEQNLDRQLEPLTKAYQSLNQSNITGVTFDNPVQELKNTLMSIGNSTFEKGKTELAIPVIKGVARKYLKNKNTDAERRLKNLGVIDSIEGLDFTQSKILEGNKNLDLVVSYRIKSFLPIKFLSIMNVRQRAVVRAWLEGEDDSTNIALDKEDLLGCSSNARVIADEVKIVEEDIWELPDITRGIKIEEIMGGHLGQYFPVIDKLENRTVIKFVSVKTVIPSYQTHSKLLKHLKSEINTLVKFKNGKKSGVEVQQKDYDNKVFNIAIPDQDLNEGQLKAISDAKLYALQKGISFKITVIKTTSTS